MIDLAAAACVVFPPEWWFADRGADHAQAIRICAACPVAQPCLDAVLTMEGAASRHGRHGVAGGLTAAERARMPRVAVPARAQCGSAA